MVRMTKLTVIPLFLLVFLFTAFQASAEYTTNKAEFMAEYPGLSHQDFSASPVPLGDILGCDSEVNSLTNDACFSPGDILPRLSFTTLGGLNPLAVSGVFFQGNPNPNKTLTASAGGDTFAVDFELGSANVVGLQVGCFSQGMCDTIVNVQSIGPGEVIVGNFDLPVSSAFDSFIGVSDRGPIIRVLISSNDSMVAGVDAVYFGNFTDIPTMSEWGMIATVAALGFISFIVIRRRRSAIN